MSLNGATMEEIIHNGEQEIIMSVLPDGSLHISIRVNEDAGLELIEEV